MAKNSFFGSLFSSFFGCILWFILFIAYLVFSVLSVGFPIFYLITYGNFLKRSLPLSNEEIDKYFLTHKIELVQTEFKTNMQICILSLIIVLLITCEVIYLSIYSKKIYWINFQRFLLLCILTFLAYKVKSYKNTLINYKNVLLQYETKTVIQEIVSNYDKLINLETKAFYHTILFICFHFINIIWSLGLCEKKTEKKPKNEQLEEPLQDIDA